ncbi:MAG: hypothetical protein GY774_04925 [Planctomycetes bacterium]|nr:hypothetical protein [Planctomycetota bacterium]
MSRINVRGKGARGERSLCKWLAENLDIEGAERNLEQVRSGGADILTDEFIFECKRVESLDVAAAWTQCAVAAREQNTEAAVYREPVLAFRRNREKWIFAISATHIGLENGYIMMSERNFILWVEKKRDE